MVGNNGVENYLTKGVQWALDCMVKGAPGGGYQKGNENDYGKCETARRFGSSNGNH